jgi:hypothetical protein
MLKQITTAKLETPRLFMMPILSMLGQGTVVVVLLILWLALF